MQTHKILQWKTLKFALLVPALETKVMPLALTAAEETTGTIEEVFYITRFRVQAVSTTMAVDVQMQVKL